MQESKEIDAQQMGYRVNELSNIYLLILDVIWESEKYVKLLDRFYYTVFSKLHMLLDGVFLQVFNLDNKLHYGLGVSLQMRTAMLDILGMFYVLDAMDDESLQIARVNTLMADHLKYTWRDLTESQKTQMQNDWKDLFENDGTLKKFDSVGTKLFMSGIVKNKNLVREAHDVLHIYKLFSKMEHNGAFTFDILHRPYYPEGNMQSKILIKESIISCAVTLKLLASHWLPSDSPLYQELCTATLRVENL